MMIATKIIRTVDKHSNRKTLHGGGEGGGYFVLSFENCPDIFGRDCSLKRKSRLIYTWDSTYFLYNNRILYQFENQQWDLRKTISP